MVPLVPILEEIDYEGRPGTTGFTQSGGIAGKLERAHQAWEKIKREAIGP